MDGPELGDLGFQVKDLCQTILVLAPSVAANAAPIQMSDSVRIDKWLWAVRVFKTRADATDACKAGHVKIDGKPVKPARSVRMAETIHAYNGHHTRVVKVLGFIEKRVGAKVVVDFMEDLTPKEELEKKRNASLRPISLVAKGKPTRKERQAINRIKDQL